MKKASLFFLTLIATTAICLAGCGKDTGARAIDSSDYRVVNDNTETKDTELLTDSTPTSTPNSSDTNSSDTDVDLNQEEGSNPEENPEAEQQEEQEVSFSAGSGNAEDYWIGDDYFDLVPYMEDNGFKVTGLNRMLDPIEAGETPYRYFCDYNDQWGIYIGNDGWCVQDFSNGIIYYAYYEEYTGRKIDIGGCTAYVEHLWALPVAVKNIKNGSDNPFLGLDESYTVDVI